MRTNRLMVDVLPRHKRRGLPRFLMSQFGNLTKHLTGFIMGGNCLYINSLYYIAEVEIYS